MSVIVPPNEYNFVEHKTFKIGTKSIKFTKYIGDSTDTLYFGGHNLFCIDALVHKPGSQFEERGIDISDAYLSHLYYNMNCSLEGDFRKGLDSVMILKLCITYIKQTYEHIKTVSFTDTSFKECDDGKFVELAEMNYIRTGKTWYQTHFHAYMDREYERKLVQSERRFQTAKQTMSWKEFKTYIKGELPIDEDVVKTMYNSAPTWQDFFGPFSEKIGIAKFCSFVAPWLHRFIESEMKFYFSSVKYYIPVEKIESVEYTSSEYAKGGKHSTRKNHKSSKRPKNLH